MSGWVTVSRAATFTRLSRQHIYRLAYEGTVASRCNTRTRKVEVWFYDVLDHVTRHAA